MNTRYLARAAESARVLPGVVVTSTSNLPESTSIDFKDSDVNCQSWLLAPLTIKTGTFAAGADSTARPITTDSIQSISDSPRNRFDRERDLTAHRYGTTRAAVARWRGRQKAAHCNNAAASAGDRRLRLHPRGL